MSRSLHLVLHCAALLVLGGCDGCDDGSSESAVPPSAPPTGLTATALSTARIDLAWTDASDNEALFIIERSTDNVTFVEIARVFLNTTSYVDRPLDAATTYHYRVLAGNSKGVSTPSNVATATTLTLTWTQESPIGGPGPRLGPTAVYDPVRQRMLVIGGLDSSYTPYNDVWALSLPAPPTLPVWSLILPDGSPGISRRWGHVAIYDDNQDRVVVFGGQDDAGPLTYQSDVWFLSLGASPQWSSPLISGSITPRLHAAGIYDSLRQELLVFGGEGLTNPLSDAAALPLPPPGPGPVPTWRSVNPPSPPSPRSQIAAIFDDVGDRMLIFGGFTGIPNNETHALRSTPPAWTGLAPPVSPAPAYGMKAVLDAPNRRMVFWSGNDTEYSAPFAQTLWALNLDGAPQWTPILSTSPMPGRAHYTAIYDALHRRMVVFGGEDDTSAITDTVEWIGF